MNTPEQKKRRGRPPGSLNKSQLVEKFEIQRVPLSALIELFGANPNALIPVKKAFAIEVLGLDEGAMPQAIISPSVTSPEAFDEDVEYEVEEAIDESKVAPLTFNRTQWTPKN